MSNFDFQKAINGEPIYCNGVNESGICYSISKQMFFRTGSITGGWNIDGMPVYNGGEKYNLTTDPPKKKVKKTVWIGLFKNMYGNIVSTTNRSQYPRLSFIKEIETEIEVEE